MKRILFEPVLCLLLVMAFFFCSSLMAQNGGKEAPLVVPKNLARITMGTLLLQYLPDAKMYVPTSVIEGWLDDGMTTSAELPGGESHYLMALTEPVLLKKFSLSAENPRGVVSIFIGDQQAAAKAPSWKMVASKVPLDQINEKGFEKPCFGMARYVLLQFQMELPTQVWSMDLYGENDSRGYRLEKKEKTKDLAEVPPARDMGPFVKSQANFNFASAYALPPQAGDSKTLMALTDESPETAAGVGENPVVMDFGVGRRLNKFSMQCEKKKGRVQVMLRGEGQGTAVASRSLMSLPWLGSGRAVLLAGMDLPRMSEQLWAQLGSGGDGSFSQIRTIDCDGSKNRFSVDLSSAPSGVTGMAISFQGASPGDSLSIKGVGALGSLPLSDFQIINTSSWNQGATPLTASEVAQVVNQGGTSSPTAVSGGSRTASTPANAEDPSKAASTTNVSGEAVLNSTTPVVVNQLSVVTLPVSP